MLQVGGGPTQPFLTPVYPQTPFILTQLPNGDSWLPVTEGDQIL